MPEDVIGLGGESRALVRISARILEIRGEKVLLDRDLAAIMAAAILENPRAVVRLRYRLAVHRDKV